MERTRRGVLVALTATAFGGCLAAGEESPGAEAVTASFGETGATDAGNLRVSITVENGADEPVEATVYAHAVEPGKTHTEARYFELAPKERVTEWVVFPDASQDGFWESGGFLEANVA